MKKIFFLTCLMLSAALTFAQATKKVAILEVVDREGRLSYSQKMMLRSNMARAITNTIGYEAYDRSDMDAIMSEQDFQRTGLVSETEIRKLNEMTGVSLILVTEAVLTGDNRIFVSVKILNVETGRVEMMDNLTMENDPQEMQNGCMKIATRLFGQTSTTSAIERYTINRISSKEYLYINNSLNEKEYARFLEINCPDAYKTYVKGKKLTKAGWATFGCGMPIALFGAFWLASYQGAELYKLDNYPDQQKFVGASLLIVGSVITAGVSVPLLSVGYTKKNNAYKMYNSKCASSTAVPLTFNLTAGQNGIGLAMQF